MSGILMPGPEPIRTARLELRRAGPEDGDLLYALFNNWNVVRWLANAQWPLSLEDVRAYLAVVSQPDTLEDYRVIAIDGLPVGAISTREEPASPTQSADGLQIGYWLGEPFWGQGIMSEAVTGLVVRLFSASAVRAIHSGVFAGNAASLRIQEKLGFVVESTTRAFCSPQKLEMPHHNTVLTRKRFEENHA